MNDRIKEIRKFFDLTQEKFADRLGVKRNTIANYEIGRNEPIDAVVSLICREFGVSEDWLRTGEGEMLNTHADDVKLAQQLGQIVSDRYPHKKKLIEAILNMSDEEVRSFTELLSKLV